MSTKATNLRKERNRPPADEPWVWLTREMLESDALKTLSRASRLVIDRMTLEHMAHAGTENGRLIVTYTDFEKFGIRRDGLRKAIADVVARGLIVVTQKGKKSTGPDRWPARYALGWLPMFDGAPALNRWKTWTKPGSPKAHPYQDIDSSTESGTRENGRNIGALVRKTVPGARTENGTGKSRKSAIPQDGKRYQGKKPSNSGSLISSAFGPPDHQSAERSG